MSETPYIYTMHKLGKQYPPDRVVLKDVTLAFLHGAKIGVLGPNGSGKSTLLKIMAGLDTRFIGDAQLAAWATVGYLSQEPELDETKDVRGNVEDGVRPTREMLDRFNAISMELGDPDAADRMDELLAEMGKLQDRIDAIDAWSLDRHLDEAMDALRLPPGDADVSTLSGGERRRVALCRLLLAAPDLLLLDEPTNHLDAESVAWLERFLGEYTGTVVAVTHDRYFLDNVAGWILELDRSRAIPFEGNYSSWLDQKQQRLALEEKQDSARQKTLAKELEWIRMTPKAKHQRTKARLSAYERLLAEDQNAKYDPSEIHIPAGKRLGDVVVQAQDVNKGYGDRLLIEDLSFDLPPGGIVGVIGPNGAGKTTLFRMIAGQDEPDSGTLRARRHGRSGLRRSEPGRPRRLEHRLEGDLRRPRPDHGRQARGAEPRLRRVVQLPRLGPAEEGRRPLGRRAQPAAPGQAAALGRQPAAARRADERPRRRHAARARGRAHRLRGLRGGHQP